MRSAGLGLDGAWMFYFIIMPLHELFLHLHRRSLFDEENSARIVRIDMLHVAHVVTQLEHNVFIAIKVLCDLPHAVFELLGWLVTLPLVEENAGVGSAEAQIVDHARVSWHHGKNTIPVLDARGRGHAHGLQAEWPASGVPVFLFAVFARELPVPQ